MTIRAMRPEEWDVVAALIFHSTNAWYQAKLGTVAFAGEPSDCRVFCEMYEAIDPNHCFVAVDDDTEEIVGSCFWHPREAHFSIGIVNVAPERFGGGIATALIRAVIDEAEKRNFPVRLVSSALNLDSFSLYTRLGFVPRAIYQDMTINVPDDGFTGTDLPEISGRLRFATKADISAISARERELSGVSREKDWAHLIHNVSGLWSVAVSEAPGGRIRGALASVIHPACRMIGPGFASTDAVGAQLIAAQLDRHRGAAPLILVPASRAELVRRLYGWGARNVELHVAQVRGVWHEPSGVVFPTFLPETG